MKKFMTFVAAAVFALSLSVAHAETDDPNMEEDVVEEEIVIDDDESSNDDESSAEDDEKE